MSRSYHFSVGPGDNSATKVMDKSVDLTSQIDDDDGDIASDANIQNSSSYFEVRPLSLPAEPI